jgi:hypothetical protein
VPRSMPMILLIAQLLPQTKSMAIRPLGAPKQRFELSAEEYYKY